MTVTDTGTAAALPDEATRLSTAPRPPGPARRGQAVRPLRQAWRQLTSMRTALLLLFLLALASVPGGFIPQRSLNPVDVQEYVEAHPTLAPVLDRLYLFDVFASPWFSAIYLLLFVSLVGCLVPRIRLHARALRTAPPRVPSTLSRLPASERWQTTAGADEVLPALRSALRRDRWRTVVRGQTVSAEKGYLRETGNLVFHVSLVGLLVGVALGGAFGFKGTVLVKEGEGFANAVLSFDDVTPGRRFSADRLVPFNFNLKDFRATYAEDGKALTFDADVDYARTPDGPRQDYTVRVNHPLHVGDAKAYLIGHGYSARVLVKDRAGEVALDQAVQCLPQNGTFVSRCTIKVPNARGRDGAPDQVGFQGVLTPTTAQDPQTGQVSSTHPAAADPALTLLGYRGDLGLDSGKSQSIYELDTTRLEQIGAQPRGLFPDDTWQLPGGGSITFVGVEEWATFQVTQDPGKWVALVSGAGMVLGLMLSLFVRRRRLWVRVTPASVASVGEGPARGRSVVEVAGLARTDSDTFAVEFAELVERLRGPAPAVRDHDLEPTLSDPEQRESTCPT